MNGRKDGRDKDMEELRNDHKNANPYEKSLIEKAANQIRNESGISKDMREHLIRARRRGDMEEVKDISDYVKNKKQYQNDR